MKLQRKLENTNWVDVDNEYVDRCLAAAMIIEQRIATNTHRETRTAEELLAALAAGAQLDYGEDWYNQLRDAEYIKPAQPARRLAYCDKCRGQIAESSLMRAGNRRLCPDCYAEWND